MDVKIALLAGDGIGPEIVAEATKVLDRVAEKFGHKIEYRPALVGAAAIDAVGDPYPDETHAVCLAADAVLFGAIGDPKYDNDPTAKVRPEQGLLRMRKSLGLFANLRPVALFDALVKAVSEGCRSFRRLAVVGNGQDYCWPCGACRQMLYEFAPELEVLVANGDHSFVKYSLCALLPQGFGPSSLGQ